MVVAQVPKSSTFVAEDVAGTIDTTGAAGPTAVAVNVVVDIASHFEATDILAKTDHDLVYCLSLCAYHILLWV